MTNNELKKALESTGMKAADVEKACDCCRVEKLTKIVEKASSPDEAFKALKKEYPEMDLKSAYSDYDFYTKQVEAAEKQAKNKSADSQQNGKALELTDAELEMVAGGAGGSGFNYKALLVGIAIAIGAAVVGAFAGGTIAALTHTGAAVASTPVGFGFVGFGAIVAKGVILGGAAGVALGGGVASSLAAPAES